jgi:hypothetical protein
LILTNNQTLATNTESTEISDVPNILTQDKAHPARSPRYSLIKTIDVLKSFQESGFNYSLISQERCRNGRAGFGTHLVALEHPEIGFRDRELDKEIKPRLYLKNSYHGGSRFMLDLGIFRMYCQNGLFVGLLLESFRKKHIGLDSSNIKQAVVDMKRALNETLIPMVHGLMETEMSEGAQVMFAKAALAERLRDNEDYIDGEFEKLLVVHRPEDKGNSAWKVLNRVQENLGLNFRNAPVDVKYRYMAKDKDGNNQVKERKVAKIGRIDEVTHINKALFDKIGVYSSPTKVQLLSAA